MTTRLLRPVMLLMLSTLMGCSTYTPLQRGQTSAIVSGADSSEVSRIVGKASLLASHRFAAQGEQFQADHYALQTGTRKEMFNHCSSRRRGCIPSIKYIPVTDSYVVIYRMLPGPADAPATDTRKVFAWGTVESLSRSPDEAVSSIMPALKASYVALSQRK